MRPEGWKQARLSDVILDQAMLDAINRIGPDARRLASEVIQPRLSEINRRLGQENDALYLAYATSHVLGLR